MTESISILDDQLPQPRQRTPIVVLGMVLLSLIIAARLVQVQWSMRVDWATKADHQQFHEEQIPARPGNIVDRNGRLLATTITAPSLYVIPNLIEDRAAVANTLSVTLEIDFRSLLSKLERYRDKHFLWIRRRLSEDDVVKIRQLGLPKKIWGFRNEYLRQYPQGSLATHVLGMRNIDGIGIGGVEQAFDHLLRGEDGVRHVVRDARGRVVDVKGDIATAPELGKTIVLSVDSVIQLFVEQELDQLVEKWKPESACITVLAPHTGEVLAMSSRPTYNPNHPTDIHESAWTNHNIASMYEPGSTFKPIIVSWALQQNAINADEVFDCERGAYRMGRRLLHDHHRYGELSVTDILVKSSNIGMAKIGERLTNDGLYQAASIFGFGRKTGCQLPGEVVGKLRPLKEWNSYSTGSIPMGHEIAVTPIQLITAHAALASEGKLSSPKLLLRTLDERIDDGKRRETESASLFSPTVDADIARWIVQKPMTQVVERGTAKKAQLDGYAVFGKTGTSQKIDSKTGLYSSQKSVCSFIGGAPAEDPQLIVLVVVDDPTQGGSRYGGTVSAPAARTILKKSLAYLGISHSASPLRTAER